MDAMALAESSDPLRDLARAADAAARRVRPWQIGHELAKELTIDGFSLTPDEVALVQAPRSLPISQTCSGSCDTAPREAAERDRAA